VHNTKTKKVF